MYMYLLNNEILLFCKYLDTYKKSMINLEYLSTLLYILPQHNFY